MIHRMSCVNWAVFFLLFTGYIFSSCLRGAYALPTPLRCFPTRGLFFLICIRVPTLTSCFLILPMRLACVAPLGFLQHRLRRKKLTNILKMPTKSLRAQAKCLRQHFTRHTFYKLNLPTKKRCSIYELLWFSYHGLLKKVLHQSYVVPSRLLKDRNFQRRTCGAGGPEKLTSFGEDFSGLGDPANSSQCQILNFTTNYYYIYSFT